MSEKETELEHVFLRPKIVKRSTSKKKKKTLRLLTEGQIETFQVHIPTHIHIYEKREYMCLTQFLKCFLILGLYFIDGGRGW